MFLRRSLMDHRLLQLLLIASMGVSGTIPLRNVCDSAPCHNGGECIDLTSPSGVKKFECACLEGYEGITCQKRINPCAAEPCENDGQCVPRIGANYHCVCTTKFHGRNCESKKSPDVCSDKPCHPNGVCVPTNEGFVCQCNEGYHGPRCKLQEPKEDTPVVEKMVVTEPDAMSSAVIALLVVFIIIIIILLLLGIHCLRVFNKISSLKAARERRLVLGEDPGDVPGWFDTSNAMCVDFFCCRRKKNQLDEVKGVIVPVDEYKSMMLKGRDSNSAQQRERLEPSLQSSRVLVPVEMRGHDIRHTESKNQNHYPIFLDTAEQRGSHQISLQSNTENRVSFPHMFPNDGNYPMPNTPNHGIGHKTSNPIITSHENGHNIPNPNNAHHRQSGEIEYHPIHNNGHIWNNSDSQVSMNGHHETDYNGATPNDTFKEVHFNNTVPTNQAVSASSIPNIPCKSSSNIPILDNSVTNFNPLISNDHPYNEAISNETFKGTRYSDLVPKNQTVYNSSITSLPHKSSSNIPILDNTQSVTTFNPHNIPNNHPNGKGYYPADNSHIPFPSSNIPILDNTQSVTTFNPHNIPNNHPNGKGYYPADNSHIPFPSSNIPIPDNTQSVTTFNPPIPNNDPHDKGYYPADNSHIPLHKRGFSPTSLHPKGIERSTTVIRSPPKHTDPCRNFNVEYDVSGQSRRPCERKGPKRTRSAIAKRFKKRKKSGGSYDEEEMSPRRNTNGVPNHHGSTKHTRSTANRSKVDRSVDKKGHYTYAINTRTRGSPERPDFCNELLQGRSGFQESKCDALGSPIYDRISSDWTQDKLCPGYQEIKGRCKLQSSSERDQTRLKRLNSRYVSDLTRRCLDFKAKVENNPSYDPNKRGGPVCAKDLTNHNIYSRPKSKGGQGRGTKILVEKDVNHAKMSRSEYGNRDLHQIASRGQRSKRVEIVNRGRVHEDETDEDDVEFSYDDDEDDSDVDSDVEVDDEDCSDDEDENENKYRRGSIARFYVPASSLRSRRGSRKQDDGYESPGRLSESDAGGRARDPQSLQARLLSYNAHFQSPVPGYRKRGERENYYNMSFSPNQNWDDKNKRRTSAGRRNGSIPENFYQSKTRIVKRKDTTTDDDEEEEEEEEDEDEREMSRGRYSIVRQTLRQSQNQSEVKPKQTRNSQSDVFSSPTESDRRKMRRGEIQAAASRKPISHLREKRKREPSGIPDATLSNAHAATVTKRSPPKLKGILKNKSSRSYAQTSSNRNNNRPDTSWSATVDRRTNHRVYPYAYHNIL